jgi:oligogalacturonide lyase
MQQRDSGEQWGKGRRFGSELRSFEDAASGVVVRQFTTAPTINHPTYFLQSSFTPDNCRLLFTSYRSGQAQLFAASLPGGDLMQLTDSSPIHPYSAAIHPNGEDVYFVRGGEIWRLRLGSLEERQIAAFPGAQLGEVSLSADGEWIACAAKHGGQNGVATGRIDGGEWHLIPFPRTVIHPQFHPLEPEWLEFAADPAPRMFRVRRDGAGMECMFEHDNDTFVVHETFLGSTGDLLFTIWPGRLCRMSWEAPRTVVDIAQFNAWHIAPDRLGARVLCDTNHPDEGIFLVNASTGERELVCLSLASNEGSQWKQSRYALPEDFAAARALQQQEAGEAQTGKQALSWMEVATDTVYGPQWTHPHPSFSGDETMIAFASNRDGMTQVYVADLSSHPKWATLKKWAVTTT